MKYTYGPPSQRGRGIGSFLAGLARKLIPVARMGARAATRVATSAPVKQAARKAAHTAIEMATEAAADAIEGKDARANLSKNLTRARTDIAKIIRQKNKPPPRKKNTRVSSKKRGKQGRKKKYNLLNYGSD